MSQDRPDIADLLATVQEFIDRITPKLEGEDRYHAQVSAYLLAICGRETRLGAPIAAAEQPRLAAFLGHDGAWPDLVRELSRDIRAGGCDGRWDAALDLVLFQVIDKVSVVRPDHLAQEHRSGHGPD